MWDLPSKGTFPLAARQAETAHPAGPGDSNRQGDGAPGTDPGHLAAALTLRLVSSRGFGGLRSESHSFSSQLFLSFFSQCFSSSLSLVMTHESLVLLPTPTPACPAAVLLPPGCAPLRGPARGRGARDGPRLSAVTVRIAQSEIALSGHRVGHRARPRLSRGRDARKQGVPEPTPNPGGEQKPIRARAWKAKRRGS